MKQGFKWYVLFGSSIVTGFLLYFLLIPFINYMFVTSKDYQLLLEQINKFLPEGSFEDVITDDFMVLSWDLTKRDPYILTKKTVKKIDRYKSYDSLAEATLMSACDPLYFKPYAKNGSVFISGNAIAESPAMYAFLQATEAGNKPSNIHVVSIGSAMLRPDKISSKIGVIDWVTRIESLQGPSKRYSHDYLLNEILSKYKKRLLKFQFPIT